MRITPVYSECALGALEKHHHIPISGPLLRQGLHPAQLIIVLASQAASLTGQAADSAQLQLGIADERSRIRRCTCPAPTPACGASPLALSSDTSALPHRQTALCSSRQPAQRAEPRQALMFHQRAQPY